MWGLRLLGIATLAIEKLWKLDAAALGILRNSNKYSFLGQKQFFDGEPCNYMYYAILFINKRNGVCWFSPCRSRRTQKRPAFFPFALPGARSGNPVTLQGAEVRRCGCHLSDLPSGYVKIAIENGHL